MYVPDVALPSVRPAPKVASTVPLGATILRVTDVTPTLSVTFADADFKLVHTSTD